MNLFKTPILIAATAMTLGICTNYSGAAEIQLTGLSILKVRAVGDYQGATFDNTIELWFVVPATWPSGSNCGPNFRVNIDAKNKHMVAAAYLALTMSKKVDVNLDDALPIRSGICEVSYLDLSAP